MHVWMDQGRGPEGKEYVTLRDIFSTVDFET